MKHNQMSPLESYYNSLATYSLVQDRPWEDPEQNTKLRVQFLRAVYVRQQKRKLQKLSFVSAYCKEILAVQLEAFYGRLIQEALPVAKGKIIQLQKAGLEIVSLQDLHIKSIDWKHPVTQDFFRQEWDFE